MKIDIEKFLKKDKKVKLKDEIPEIYTLSKKEKEYLGQIVIIKEVLPYSRKFSIFSAYSAFGGEEIMFPFEAIERPIFEETYENDKAICPVCGCEIDDMWEYEMNDGEDIEIECPKCETELEIELSITYSYTTRVKGED